MEELTLIRVGLVGCVKEKSPYRSKARRYVERNYNQWFILSAKYYLVDPEKEIDPCDETLKDKSVSERKAKSGKTYDQLHVSYPDPKKQVYIFHAGEGYREIMPLLEMSGYRFETLSKDRE